MKTQSIKNNLHQRSLHRKQYDINALTQCFAPLQQFVIDINNRQSIDFSNPQAVICLNTALLKKYYGIDFWSIPTGFLCPPIPGRADYIHYLADLLQSVTDKTLQQNKVKVLDIGTGASCIYPILGQKIYRWKFVGTDIDPISARCSTQITKSNKGLDKHIKIRLQPDKNSIFENIIQPEDIFDLSMCNPPFHRSLEEALAGNSKKRTNLAKSARSRSGQQKNNDGLNFGGQKAELYCQGGELEFISKMIIESVSYKKQVLYFSSLVSKSVHLSALKKLLNQHRAADIQVISMSQGNKISRFLAWSFIQDDQRKLWAEQRLTSVNT